MIRRCEVCNNILVPEPRIESILGEPLQICMSCLITGVKEIEAEINKDN